MGRHRRACTRVRFSVRTWATRRHRVRAGRDVGPGPGSAGSAWSRASAIFLATATASSTCTMSPLAKKATWTASSSGRARARPGARSAPRLLALCAASAGAAAAARRTPAAIMAMPCAMRREARIPCIQRELEVLFELGRDLCQSHCQGYAADAYVGRIRLASMRTVCYDFLETKTPFLSQSRIDTFINACM